MITIENMEKNELKKQLMLQKTMAHFTHYCDGSLYYAFTLEAGMFTFPIKTVEYRCGTRYDGEHIEDIIEMELSSDLGTTKFLATERASFFWRWIDKAIDAGEFDAPPIPPPPAPPEDRIIREGKEPRPPR